jgi:hybrid cluster-associated redox disulfide protein
MLSAMTTSRRVSADDTIAALLTRQPSAARILIDRGMPCVGCAIAAFETIRDACAIYDVSVDELLEASDRLSDATIGEVPLSDPATDGAGTILPAGATTRLGVRA